MILFLLFALAASPAQATLPALIDLAADSAIAVNSQQPIVVYVSRSDCTFCRRFENDVLRPLMKSKRFAGQVLFRELVMDARELVRNRQGKQISARALAEEMEVQVTPTLLFFDGKGRTLSRTLRGYDGNVYASYYFERAIDQAITKLADTATD